jgi:hypothetical protein
MSTNVGAIDLAVKLKKGDIAKEAEKIGKAAGKKMGDALGKESTKSASGLKGLLSSLKTSLGGVASAALKAGAAIAGVFAVRKLIDFGKACVSLGSDLAEVQNVVDVTFGDMAGQVDAFAQSAITSFGLSETVAKQYAGQLGAMAKAFNFTDEQAAGLAETITGLAGDVSSFYNISSDEAFSKLKGIFTGETEGLKSLGVVMTQAALDQFALANGFGKTTNQMSEAEKVALRYQFVMNALSGAQGDFQRTSSGWANQVRVLSLSFDQLRATIGQGLIYALTPAIQMLNAFIAKLQFAANVFRSFMALVFGAHDDGGMSGMADALGAAAESANGVADGISAAGGAAKKAVRALAGFDKINVLASSDNAGGGGGGGGGASSMGAGAFEGMDFGDMGVGSLNDGLDKAKELAQRIYDIFQQYKPLIEGVAAGIAAWGLASALGKVLGLEMGFGKLLGVALLVGGAVTAITAGIDAWNNGLNLDNATQMIVGLSLAVLGANMAFGLLGMQIAGIVAGLALFAIGIHDSIKNGISPLSGTITVLGGAMTGAFIGSFFGPVGALIGGLIGALVGVITDGVILIIQNWEYMGDAFALMKDDLMTGLSAIGDGIADIFSALVDCVSEDLETISDVFTRIFEGLENIGRSALNGVIAIVESNINGIINAVNLLISGINVLGSVAGIPNLGTLSNITIPRLAQGGYVNANSPQLAIVGDNRHEGEIIAPESKIQEAVTAGMMAILPFLNGANGGNYDSRPIILELDGQVLWESNANYSTMNNKRSGGR